MHSQRLCNPCFTQAIHCQTQSLFHMKYPWQLPAFKRGWEVEEGGRRNLQKFQVHTDYEWDNSRLPQEQTSPPSPSAPPKKNNNNNGEMKPMFPKADTPPPPPPPPPHPSPQNNNNKQTNKQAKNMAKWNLCLHGFTPTNFKSSRARRDLDGRQQVLRSENSQRRRKWNYMKLFHQCGIVLHETISPVWHSVTWNYFTSVA